jgi:hypothetical protein
LLLSLPLVGVFDVLLPLQPSTNAPLVILVLLLLYPSVALSSVPALLPLFLLLLGWCWTLLGGGWNIL